MRNLSLAAVFLATFVGFFSAAEVVHLGSPPPPPVAATQPATATPFTPDPQMTAAMVEAQTSALEGMKTSRAVVLSALAVCCALVWVSATRLVRGEGLPREGVRRMLAASLILAAFLRAIDGAQSLVAARRAAAAAVPFILHQPGLDAESAAMMGQMMPLLMGGAMVLFTAVVAGGMLLLGQYFRSEKVKQVVALQDQQLQ